MLVSGGRGVEQKQNLQINYENVLIAPLTERSVWCYAKHLQDLFEGLMKMSMEYVKGIAGEFNKYFKKNKRNLIIPDGVMDKALKLPNCLHVIAITIFR